VGAEERAQIKGEAIREDIGYNVYVEELNTLQHGLPQHRRRLFIIGILRSADRKTFKFPKPIAWTPCLNDVLDCPCDDDGGDSVNALVPGWHEVMARRNVLQAFKKMQSKGEDPFRTPLVVDIGSTAAFATHRTHAFPCITASRGNGLSYWLSPCGRRGTANELLRAQGYSLPENLNVSGITPNQLGKLAGNGISLCVLERVLWRALVSAGLHPGKCLLGDPWATRDSPRVKDPTALRSSKQLVIRPGW
jgi:site-specific DNA-cytosine methylase